jgi:hypothetical protein
MHYLLLISLIYVTACKHGYLNVRGSNEKKQSVGADPKLPQAVAGDAIPQDNRPSLPEEQFVIPDADIPLEGVLQRRPEGGIDVGGAIAGVWDKTLSPVYIKADAVLGPDKVLIIKAGVQVVSQGSYRFSVEGGQLKINGTQAEPVVMTAADKSTGWGGIRVCPDAECRSEEPKGKLEVRFARFESAKKQDTNPNDSTWRRGGALYVRGTATAIIEDSVFLGNYALERGGAIEIIADNRNVIFRRNVLERNQNDGNAGGALHITHGRNLSLEGNTFIGNTSKGEGGAVYLLDTAALVMRGNTFRDNVSGTMGGAVKCDGHAITIDIDRSNMFSGNKPDDISCDP